MLLDSAAVFSHKGRLNRHSRKLKCPVICQASWELRSG